MQNPPNLFIPPSGLVRSIPEDKTLEYTAKFKQLGPFRKHVYDLDICTLYRQIDDLKATYQTFASQPYQVYVDQLRLTIQLTLTNENVDPDFYLNHFYFVLRPESPQHLAYLGIFLAMSDPYKVVPILEYQLYQVLLNPNLSIDSFLGELEYTACNFIRTNRFPEDWFFKHEKIINWIYSRKDALRYEFYMTQRMERLINLVNEVLPKKIPVEVLKETTVLEKEKELQVVEKMRTVLFNDLKEYFSEQNHATLQELLAGEADPSIVIIFNGSSTQLSDVFRIYLLKNLIDFKKGATAKWICNHFMYFDEDEKKPKNFSLTATERIIYGGRLPKNFKPIHLSKISGRFTYNRKKSNSERRSDQDF